MVPRWIVRLLERVVASDEHDDVIGDLEEMHGRRSARLGRMPATIMTVVEGLVLCANHGLRLIPGSGLSWTEVRLALRMMLRQPVMTVTSIVALGIGIGIAAGGFSVFRQALYSDLPFENGDRWVVIETWDDDTGSRSRLDLERLRAFRASASAFDYIAGAESVEFNVVHDDGRIERVPGARVTPVVCLQLMVFDFPVNDYFTKAKRGDEGFENEFPDRSRQFVGITRREYVVRRYALTSEQFTILSELQRGATVSAALMAAALDSAMTHHELARNLKNWFSQWIDEGMFARIELP